MVNYRILTNGINYRVQWLGKTRLLQRPKWRWLYKHFWDSSYIAEFNTVLEAELAVAEDRKQAEAYKQGYVPIIEGNQNEL